MKANSEFLNRNSAFWAYTQLISEKLGYSSKGLTKSYTKVDFERKLAELNISFNDLIIVDVLKYLEFRADILNNHVKHLLMDVNKARCEFEVLKSIHTNQDFLCSLPLNKQKNEKRDFAYFTGIINILTEKTLREFASENELVYGVDIMFDNNPMNLSYVTDNDGNLQGIMSRRFDGAFPSTFNPLAIWEIKEYYYTTTFGSRIADGVYETQLDGYEIRSISERTNRRIKHIYFIDDFNTWWTMGKSYLCRIIDMLHQGLVDEVIFGNEVFNRWPIVIHEILLNFDK